METVVPRLSLFETGGDGGGRVVLEGEGEVEVFVALASDRQ